MVNYNPTYFYDTEFLEDGETIELISIGIVSPNDNREYYAVNSEVNNNQGLGGRIANSKWLMDNVVPHLPLSTGINQYPGGTRGYMPPNLNMRDVRVKPKWVIANEVRDFLTLMNGMHIKDDLDLDVILWSWYSAYDHVALMQLWGSMIKKPRGLPMYTRDLRQELDRLGGDIEGPELPQQTEAEHNALTDARYHVEIARTLGIL